jgi:lysophospholipase L1-like esterase
MPILATICVRIILGCLLLLGVISLTSGAIRSQLVDTVSISVARIYPLEYAFIGDSLTVDCELRWRLSSNPFDAISVARGGADIRGAVHQVNAVAPLRPKVLFIAIGINDVLLERAPAEQIAYDSTLLLARIPKEQKTYVTSIPYVSDKSRASDIAAANIAISALASLRGMTVIDLNPAIAVDGMRMPNMTVDGVHFSERACAIWTRIIQETIVTERAQ